MQPRRIVGSAFLSLVAASGAARGQDATSPPPVAAHLDHVMFLTAGQRQLTALLVDTLGLPLIWPQPGSAWTSTSGVGFGNTTLELVRVDSTVQPRLSSLAFQAANFQTLAAALDRRGIRHGDSMPGPVAPDRPDEGPRWQIIGLPGMGRGAFFIEYRFDMDERRDRFRRQLNAANGGALGIRRVRQVVAGVSSPDSTTRLWRNLLGLPTSGDSARWLVAELSVRIVPNDHPDKDSFIVQVRSLDAAEQALLSLGISARRTGSTLVVDPARLHGLRLVLVQ